MGTGFLKVQLYVGDYALHGDSVTVLIKRDGEVLYTLQSDENGTTETVSIEAPDLKDTDGLSLDKQFYSIVDVQVPKAQDYKGVKVYGVKIFDGITSILPIHMEPIAPGESTDEIEIYIPREHGVDIDRDNGQPDNHEPGQGPGPDSDPLPRDGSRPEDDTAQERPPSLTLDDLLLLDAAQPAKDARQSSVPPSMDPEDYAKRALEKFDNDPSALIAPLNVPLANEVVIPEFITVHLGWPNIIKRIYDHVPCHKHTQNNHTHILPKIS